MYMNAGYLNRSHMDFKDKSRPLIVGSCGTYRLSSLPKLYSGSVVKTKIQAFYNEPISVAELGRCPR